MRKIIASLDVGSSLIKLIVGEVVKNKVNILACVDTPARGIKKGYVINTESAKEAFIELFKKCDSILGIKINKVLVSVPSTFSNCFLASGIVTIKRENNLVNNKDIIRAMEKSVKDKITDNLELISIQPSIFKINNEIVPNPLDIAANELEVKSVAITIPKKNVIGIETVLNSIGVEIIDYIISPLADYYQYRQKDFNTTTGAIINIGSESTTVSIFNKGILTNIEVLDIGSYAITKDLAYVYKVTNSDAAYLREHLALAHTRLSQPNESLTFTDRHGEMVKINQYDASEIVMGRLQEILNLAKKQINLLTKKEISYIMIVGGVTETQDFDILVEETFGNSSFVGQVLEIGARNNIYGTSIGMIKYYNSRLRLQNKEFTILDKEEEDKLGGSAKKGESSVLGKLFAYFFDN